MKYIPKDKTIIEVAKVFPALCRKINSMHILMHLVTKYSDTDF